MDTAAVSANIRGLLPAIRRRREEVEEARRLPRDLVGELGRTGVFGLTIPRSIGGIEASPLDVMKTIETVAAADGSVGWCTMIATGNNVVSGYMSEAGAAEVFSDPEAPSAGIAAPAGAAVPVADGVRVSGRWGFASGITHCDWVWAGCLVMEDGRPRMTSAGPDIIHVCLPVRDVVIHDTWHVSGLKGTGSNDFTVSDVFVPEHRIFKLLDPSGHRQEPLYQMPPLPLFVFQLACVGLGIARGALDDFTELAQTKTPTLYTMVLADKSIAQIDLARAETALGGARALLRETVDEIWQTVCAGHAPTARQIALGRAAATNASTTASSVTHIVDTLAGGSSMYSSASLQRHARDAEAVTHHFTVAPHTWERHEFCWDASRFLRFSEWAFRPPTRRSPSVPKALRRAERAERLLSSSGRRVGRFAESRAVLAGLVRFSLPSGPDSLPMGFEDAHRALESVPVSSCI